MNRESHPLFRTDGSPFLFCVEESIKILYSKGKPELFVGLSVRIEATDCDNTKQEQCSCVGEEIWICIISLIKERGLFRALLR